MMRARASNINRMAFGLVVVVLCGLMFVGCSEGPETPAASRPAPVPMGFDSGGEKIFNAQQDTPVSQMISGSGDRNLAAYYDLRQYPGSPPRIPHEIETSFSEKAEKCLSCHEKGGYDAEMGKAVPITPHPEKESCRQCHVPKRVDTLFVENEWKSIGPPRLGSSFLPGSPPPIPHSLQMRDNCIACHTGLGSVVEIRVEHATRGNCRQCHVPAIPSEPFKVFKRES